MLAVKTNNLHHDDPDDHITILVTFHFRVIFYRLFSLASWLRDLNSIIVKAWFKI